MIDILPILVSGGNFGIAISILVTVILLVLGVPVVFGLGLGVLLLLEMTGSFNFTFMADGLFTGLDTFALIAIPLFILTGDAIVETGTSEELIVFANTLVGGFRSGVGSATVLGCGFFAAISGSNAAGAAAVGRITHDSLKDFGYPGDYAAALIASGAATGILIPPSIAYIIVAVTIGVSVSDLFIAAIIPGTIVLLTIMLTNTLVNRRFDYEQGTGFTRPTKIAKAAWEAREGLIIPVIILGGIYSGIFTPTESAAVAVAAVLAIGMVQGTVTLKSFQNLFERSAVVNGTIAPIIAVALSFSQVLNTVGLPSLIVEFFAEAGGGYYVVVLMMFVVLVLAGAVMETTPNILLLAPLLAPVATEIGMSPIHFAVFLNTALGVGFITPPFGMNLYVVSGVTDESFVSIAKQVVPFVIALMVTTIIIGFIPSISTIIVGG